MDIRKRMLASVRSGVSCKAAAMRFSAAPSPVIKLMQAFRTTGSLEPKPMGGYRKAILGPHEAAVKELVAATPDATLAELVQALRKMKIRASRSALAAFLAKLRLTFK